MPDRSMSWEFESEAPLRVDRFLTGALAGISRAYVQNLILKKLVRINGKTAKKGDLVHDGDSVQLEAFVRPEERRIEPNHEISLDVVWQSEDFAVVNKPAGLPTHPNDYSDTNTLAHAFIARFPEAADVGDDRLRPGIVHRLDTDTSGLLLVAKNQEAFRVLRKLFDDRKIQKTYLALVLGEVRAKGEVLFPIAHHPKNPRKMVAVKSGTKIRSRIREAKTLYDPVEHYEGYTLLRVRTLTGRMHQVRVHLSAIGHPLCGDRLYQNSKQRSQDTTGLKRHFLHASTLVVPIDSSKPELFECPLAPELADCLSRLSCLSSVAS